ncbi:MAG: hypothetical protein WCA85_31050 [Paraburkholderia sp.]|uniref:hypothetical protein n=1 Tax=Paraburkholderia sp. TaxID=1926495 RepID=UPI003C56516E
MVRPSQSGATSSKAVRQLLLVAILTVVCGLQGCANSIETLGLGLGLGAAGAVGGAVCMISCH